MKVCPWSDCGRTLEGLGTFCHSCMKYADDYRPEGVSPVVREDTRSEKEIQAAATNALRAMGFLVWNLSQPRATMQGEGLADLFVAGRGITAWIEMKTAAGKQSDDQERFQRNVEANGGHYLLARHESEVVEWLAKVAA